MSPIDELRSEIKAARDTLGTRLRTTTDERERTALTASIKALTGQLAILNQAALLTATHALAKVTDQLEKAVGAARVGPFDNYLAALQGHFERLSGISHALHTSDEVEVDAEAEAETAVDAEAEAGPAATRAGRAAPKKAKKRAGTQARDADADAPGRAAPIRAAASFGAAPLAPAARQPAPIRTASVQGMPPRAAAISAVELAGAAGFVPIVSTKFADLHSEYEQLWERCTVRPEFQSNVKYYLERLNKGRAMYDAVGQELGIPWAFIGVIHGMESSFNFYCHLHNGDPLTARTVQVPKGRPVNGAPPYTWRDSALDALQLKKLDQVQDWSVPNMLYLLESYNGFGYRKRRVPSPYLWSFSSVYEKGKFVQDGAFDANAVSKQCGAGLMLKQVLDA